MLFQEAPELNLHSIAQGQQHLPPRSLAPATMDRDALVFLAKLDEQAERCVFLHSSDQQRTLPLNEYAGDRCLLPCCRTGTMKWLLT